MGDEQRRMARSGAQPEGRGPNHSLAIHKDILATTPPVVDAPISSREFGQKWHNVAKSSIPESILWII